MLYAVTNATAAAAIVSIGRAANIGWFYVTGNPGYSAYNSLPSTDIWNAVITALAWNQSQRNESNIILF